MSELQHTGGNTGGKRPPLRLISIAWGESYVDTFLELCLPALLAPGNMPALAEHFDVELVFLTETRFFEKVRGHASFARAAQVCAPRVMSLDDLVATRRSYGMSLTYAFFRGFQDLGPAMTDCTMVFIHADFILADGGYRNLLPHLLRGDRLVLSPSYCTIAEDVRPDLLAARAAGEPVLAVPPRRMAELVLRNRHYTIRSKTVNQRFFCHRYTDQFYWMVDESTMLGHQMPIAVVAMKPERCLEDVAANWDYGVIYDFCPSGKYTVLGDSDEFLMLELRDYDISKLDLSLGWRSPREIAAVMAKIMTEYSRGIGRARLTLHAGDLPAGTENAHRELDAFVEDVHRHFPRTLPSHSQHFQWTHHFPTFHAARSEFLARREAARGSELAADLNAKKALADSGDSLSSTEFERARADVRATLARMIKTVSSGLEPAMAADFARTLQKSAKGVDVFLAFETARSRFLVEVFHLLEILKRPVSKDDRQAIAQRLATVRDISAQMQSTGSATASFVQHDLTHIGTSIDGVISALELVDTARTYGHDAAVPATEKRGLLRRISQLLFGSAPRYRPWHWLNSSTRFAIAAAQGVTGTGRKTLLLDDGLRLFGMSTAQMAGVKSAPLAASQFAGMLRHLVEGSAPFDGCLICTDFADLRNFRSVCDEVRPLLRPGATIVALFVNVRLMPIMRDDPDFIRKAFPVCGPARIAYSGSWASVRAFRLRLGIARNLARQRGFGDSAANAIGMLAAAPFALIGSLLESGRTLDNAYNPPRTVTGVTIEIKVG